MLLEGNDLELLPYAAMEIRGGTVSSINKAAQALLPQLKPGAALPDALAAAFSVSENAGSFTRDEDTFHFLRLTTGDSQLLLFRSAGDSSVTGAQLDGFFRQMREFMGEEFNRLQLRGPQQPPRSGRDFHRALRLMNDLEFLRIPMDQARSLFHPTAMDLAGLCMDIKRQAAPLLRKAQLELCYVSDCTGLLIPGDPELLQRLLLSLIADAAKSSPGGKVTLTLRPWFDRAVLTVTGSSPAPSDLAALLQGDSSPDAIPTPGSDAALGLDAARRIASLHRGTLLLRTGEEGSLIYTVALPTGPLPASATLRTPKTEQNAGISPFLLELSEILPEQLFEDDNN